MPTEKSRRKSSKSKSRSRSRKEKANGEARRTTNRKYTIKGSASYFRDSDPSRPLKNGANLYFNTKSPEEIGALRDRYQREFFQCPLGPVGGSANDPVQCRIVNPNAGRSRKSSPSASDDEESGVSSVIRPSKTHSDRRASRLFTANSKLRRSRSESSSSSERRPRQHKQREPKPRKQRKSRSKKRNDADIRDIDYDDLTEAQKHAHYPGEAANELGETAESDLRIFDFFKNEIENDSIEVADDVHDILDSAWEFATQWADAVEKGFTADTMFARINDSVSALKTYDDFAAARPAVPRGIKADEINNWEPVIRAYANAWERPDERPAPDEDDRIYDEFGNEYYD